MKLPKLVLKHHDVVTLYSKDFFLSIKEDIFYEKFYYVWLSLHNKQKIDTKNANPNNKYRNINSLFNLSIT